MADPQRSKTFKSIHSELSGAALASANRFIKIAALGNIQPLNPTTIEVLRSKYGPNEYDVPIVEDSTHLPWSRLPDISEMQKMLADEVQEMEYIKLSPSTGSRGKDRAEALKLIASLGQPNWQGLRSIFGLSCTHLDQLRNAELSFGDKLTAAGFRCDVMPAGAILDLDCNDRCEINTLISGTKVWIQYAPTECNRRIMADYMQVKDLDSMKVDGAELPVFRKLEGGVAFVQRPGDTIYIAPYCPVFAICSKASIAASKEVTTATKLAMRFRNLDLLNIQYVVSSEPDKEAELLLNLQTLVGDLKTTLENKFQGYDAGPVIEDIIEMWDEDLQPDFHALIEGSGDTQMRDSLAQMWSNYMISGDRTVDQTCCFCSETLRWNKKGKEVMRKRLVKHFLKTHWDLPQ